MLIAKKLFQALRPTRFAAFFSAAQASPFLKSPILVAKVEPVDDSSQLNFQKYTPMLQRHQKVLFAISPENRKKIAENRIQKDKIYLAFFRKFKEVNVYEHAKRQVDQTHSTNAPRNCWYQIKIPFSTQIELRTRFQRHYSEQLRVSKLMEVLDHVASKIALDFCYDNPDVTIQTLCVDHMNFYNQMDSNKDLYISGYPTYQSHNHIEVQIDLMQPDKEGNLVLTSCASFLLAATDKHNGKPFSKVPKLVFEGEENKERCQNRYNIGKENTIKRQYGNTRNSLVSPPEQHEIQEIHNIFLQNEQQSMGKVTMESTLETKILLMQSQERNLEGQIYGGHLMKESLDLAWVAAHDYVNTPKIHHKFPEICHLDDFQFLLPVEVSNVINFEAKVVYVKKNFIMIQVQCSKLDSLSSKQLTNQSYSIFRVEGFTNLKQVYPLTYKESLIYLEAKRRFHTIIE